MTAVIPVQFMTKRPLDAKNNDTRVNNCALWVPNGSYIAAGPNYAFDMPNAYPTTWGLGNCGFVWGNGYGYHFLSGTSDIGLPQTNVRNYSTISTQTLGPISQTNRNFNNCNCNPGYGAGVINCYSNCNCNCNCACGGDCNCNCNCDCGK